jgi:dCTP deaminase
MSTSNQSQIAFLNGLESPAEDAQPRTTGILPSQEISNLIARGHIRATPAVDPDHIQPASLDLRLGDMAHRVRASFLPGPNATVADKIKDLRMARVDLTGAPVFEKDCVYIIPLVEELSLPDNISGRANPKSTTGRLDIFTRLITDYGTEFDSVPQGYKGKLYAEVVSRTFTVAIRAGMRLSQLRFVQGSPRSGDRTIKDLDHEEPLVYMDESSPVKAQLQRGLRITVNLEASEPGEIIAYKAKRYAPVIELDRVGFYPSEEFWEVRHQHANKNRTRRLLHSCVPGTSPRASRLRRRNGSLRSLGR